MQDLCRLLEPVAVPAVTLPAPGWSAAGFLLGHLLPSLGLESDVADISHSWRLQLVEASSWKT